MNDVKEQTAIHLKQAGNTALGAVGVGATWGLSDVAAGVSILVGIATFAYMCSMVWLNIKKGKAIEKGRSANSDIEFLKRKK